MPQSGSKGLPVKILTDEYVTNVASALTMLILPWVIVTLYSFIKTRTKWLMGNDNQVSSKTFPRSLPTALRLGVFGFIFWFLITQLRALVDAPGPPTRLDTLLISFWTSWLVLVFLKLLADFGPNYT